MGLFSILFPSKNERLDEAIEKNEFTVEHAELAVQLRYPGLASKIYEKIGDLNSAAKQAEYAEQLERASELYEKCHEYYSAWTITRKDTKKAKRLADLAIKNKDSNSIHIVADENVNFPKKTIDLVIELTIQEIQKKKFKSHTHYVSLVSLEDLNDKLDEEFLDEESDEELSNGVEEDLAIVLNRYKPKEKTSFLIDIAPYSDEGIIFINKVLRKCNYKDLLKLLEEDKGDNREYIRKQNRKNYAKIKEWIPAAIERTLYSRKKINKNLIKGLCNLARAVEIGTNIAEKYLKKDELEKSKMLIEFLNIDAEDLMRTYKKKGELELIRNLRKVMIGTDLVVYG